MLVGFFLLQRNFFKLHLWNELRYVFRKIKARHWNFERSRRLFVKVEVITRSTLSRVSTEHTAASLRETARPLLALVVVWVQVQLIVVVRSSDYALISVESVSEVINACNGGLVPGFHGLHEVVINVLLVRHLSFATHGLEIKDAFSFSVGVILRFSNLFDELVCKNRRRGRVGRRIRLRSFVH